MEASPEDLVVTEKIKKTGKMLGITLIDHIIVSNEENPSLRHKTQSTSKTSRIIQYAPRLAARGF
jgi:hypothetical protein